MLFANYLIVLKEVMYKLNQDFAIDEKLPTLLKEQVTPQARLYNWNYLCTELDVSQTSHLLLFYVFYLLYLL